MPSMIQQTNGYNQVDKSKKNGESFDGNNGDVPTETYDDVDVFQHLAKPQQDVLLLHGPRQKYALEKNTQLPELRSDREILIQVRDRLTEAITHADELAQVVAIGLNPVDWKGPYVAVVNRSGSAMCTHLINSDYNFGLPSFPWINGRDFAGIVVKTGRKAHRVKLGDVVKASDWRH